MADTETNIIVSNSKRTETIERRSGLHGTINLSPTLQSGFSRICLNSPLYIQNDTRPHTCIGEHTLISKYISFSHSLLSGFGRVNPFLRSMGKESTSFSRTKSKSRTIQSMPNTHAINRDHFLPNAIPAYKVRVSGNA